MSNGEGVPEVVHSALSATRWSQILLLVKENQLVTALCLFVLWQTGAILTVSTAAGGAICG
jgi:hypothetical protein